MSPTATSWCWVALSDVVHTAKGERYIPNYIENRLKFSPYVKDAAVLGSGRDVLSAIICIDKEPVGLWAELRGISYISYADLSQKPRGRSHLIAAAVQHVNCALPEPDCSCGTSSACTRNSMPTTAKSRAPARSAATSSRSATSRSSMPSMVIGTRC